MTKGGHPSDSSRSSGDRKAVARNLGAARGLLCGPRAECGSLHRAARSRVPRAVHRGRLCGLRSLTRTSDISAFPGILRFGESSSTSRKHLPLFPSRYERSIAFCGPTSLPTLFFSGAFYFMDLESANARLTEKYFPRYGSRVAHLCNKASLSLSFCFFVGLCLVSQ